jgi:hypothetical protein
MKTRDGVLWLLTWAIVAFALVYAVVPPMPRLIVPDGGWHWTVPEGTPSIGWYGRMVASVVAAALATALAYAVHDGSYRVRAFIDTKRGVQTMTAVIFIVLTVAGLYLVFTEWQHWFRA